MQKLFGIVVIALGVWVGMEVYTKGTHAALGGIFANFAEVPAHAPQPPLKSIEQRGNDARDRQMQRIEDQLNDTAPPRD